MAFSNDNGPFNLQNQEEMQRSITTLQNEVKALQESLLSVSNSFNSHKNATYTNEQNPHNTAALNTDIAGCNTALAAHTAAIASKASNDDLAALTDVVANKQNIDILNWTPVIAYPKVCDDTFVFLLARLSKDYSQTESTKRPVGFSPKPATLYAKYFNTHSFDLCTNTSTRDLHVMLNRVNAAHELKVGLYKGTYSPTGEEDIFIGIKYTDLYLIDNQFNADIPIDVLITGINVLPIESSKQGSITSVTTIKEVTSPAGYYTVLNDITTSYSNSRPQVVAPDGIHTIPFLEDASIPVGSLIKWPANAVSIPNGYRQCDGSLVGTASDYPAYAAVFGVTEPAELLYTPIETNAIIKVTA